MKKKATSNVDTLEHLTCLPAEQALLGCILLSFEHLDLIECEANHFHTHAHQQIFEQASQLHHENSTADLIALIDRLQTQGKLSDVGGETYLWTLAHNAGSSSSLSSYAEIIREKALVRHLAEVGRSITEKALSQDETPLSDKIDWAETQVFGLRTTKKTIPWQSGRVLLPAVLDALDQQSRRDFPGLKTGFHAFDQLTLGLRASQLMILAARPSMGKTTLALNIATHIAREQPVLFFSLETPAQDLFLKVLSAEQRLPLPQLQQANLSEENWMKLMTSQNALWIDNLCLEEPASLSLHDLRSRLRRFIRSQGRVGLVVVDYLQLMSIPGYNANQRVAEISEISRGLKAIAREFKIPVLALSQLNRELERRLDRRPTMSDLRESGSIEQDADLITFIYRDEVYNPESTQKGLAEILIAKHRNGQIGKINLSFEGQYGVFKNA